MTARTSKTIAGLALVLITGYAALRLMLPPLSVQAAANDLPPRPTPRPTRLAHTGAFIQLQAQFSPTWPWAKMPGQELYTLVQWQDGHGNWHNVEGWQGTFDEIVNGVGIKLWWVAESDLGSGPFRWVICKSYAEPTKILAKSEPFHLPSASRQVLTVKVLLAP